MSSTGNMHTTYDSGTALLSSLGCKGTPGRASAAMSQLRSWHSCGACQSCRRPQPTDGSQSCAVGGEGRLGSCGPLATNPSCADSRRHAHCVHPALPTSGGPEICATQMLFESSVRYLHTSMSCLLLVQQYSRSPIHTHICVHRRVYRLIAANAPAVCGDRHTYELSSNEYTLLRASI